MNLRYIGVDLGGTSMKMGIVNGEGKIVIEKEEPTHAEEGSNRVIQRLVQSVRNLTEEALISWSDIKGIGVGLPGFLDIANGKIKHLTNLGGWVDLPIRDLLEDAWQKPVAIDNDANVAALGEAWLGAGVGVNHQFFVTLGTGVGGGLILEGKLVRGMNDCAGEIGHIQIDPKGQRCNCGQVGCLETVSSGTAIVQRAQKLITTGQPTLLHQVENLTAHQIFDAAAQKDPLAIAVIQPAIQALAQAFSILSVVINPALFIIGGGLSKAGDPLFLPLREKYTKYTQKNAQKDVRIIPAQLGNRAGFIGAARLIAQQEN